MTRVSSHFRVAVLWGAVLAVAGVLILALSAALSPGARAAADWAGFAVPVLALIFGQLQFRSGRNSVDYGDAYGAGALVVFFGSLLLVGLAYVYFAHVDGRLVAEALEAAQAEIRSQRLDPDAQEMATAIARLVASPLGFSVVQGISTLIYGLVAALFTSVFVRKSG